MDPMTDENSVTSAQTPAPMSDVEANPVPSPAPVPAPEPAPSPMMDTVPAPAPSVEPSPAPEAAPTAPVFKPDNKTEESDEIVEFSDKEPFNWPLLWCWVACFIAVASAGYFYLIKQSAEAKLTDDKSQLDQVNSQIQSSAYVNAERSARAFKSAVTELETAKANRYLMSDFLPVFYQRIAKNVVINNITITADAKVSLDGTTDSYRSVSDQLLSFKSWQIGDKNVLSSVDLSSVSEKVTGGKTSVTFVITTVLADKTMDFTGKSAAAAAAAATTGGTSAQN